MIDLFTRNRPQARRTQDIKASSNQRKHHWLLGSLIIIMGGWITHTTTATINEPTVERNHLTGELPTPQAPQQITQQVAQKIQITTQPPAISQTEVLHIQPTQAEQITQPIYTTVAHQVKKGESLGMIFSKRGFDQSLAYKISRHELAKQLVSISIGKTMTFMLDDEGAVREIHYPNSALETLVVAITEEQAISADTHTVPHTIETLAVSGEITNSLYEAARQAGLSTTLVMEMVRIFGWDVDFVLDIRQGDNFHVIHSQHITSDGSNKKLSDGEILAAEFTTQGKVYRAIRFTQSNGDSSYYSPQGDSMLGTFLRSPVELSRISSRFGKRKHPILKTWRKHKGVDYAASRGTPIRTTASGKVIHAGRKGGYGNTVIVRHAGRFTTLYAHMTGFAKGIKRGKQVKQGDIIGYIGSTGLATGPHLHYEFRLDGVHHNPLTFKTPKASSIKPEQQIKFAQLADHWSLQLDAQKRDFLLAKAQQDFKQDSEQG